MFLQASLYLFCGSFYLHSDFSHAATPTRTDGIKPYKIRNCSDILNEKQYFSITNRNALKFRIPIGLCFGAGMRAFIALCIPEQIRKSLYTGLSSLAIKCGAKPIPEQNLHITLEFLGDINEDVANNVSSLIKSFEACSFEAKLGPVSTFGNKSSVAFAALEKGAKDVASIQKRLHSELFNIIELPDMLDIDKRAFVPHVSIARGQPKSLNELAELSTKYWKGSEFFILNRMEFKKSILSQSSATYETIFGKELP